jgi:hypothetical protein
MPRIAGMLSIIAGTIGILGSVIAIVLYSCVNNLQNNPGSVESSLGDPVGWAFIISFFIINIMAILGGMLAIKRKLWGIALAGAICALLSLWAGALGIASIVFLTLSKDEFGKIYK